MVPVERTIDRILQRHGLQRTRPRKRAKESYPRLNGHARGSSTSKIGKGVTPARTVYGPYRSTLSLFPRIDRSTQVLLSLAFLSVK
jgi:hypothetical protein